MRRHGRANLGGDEGEGAAQGEGATAERETCIHGTVQEGRSERSRHGDNGRCEARQDLRRDGGRRRGRRVVRVIRQGGGRLRRAHPRRESQWVRRHLRCGRGQEVDGVEMRNFEEAILLVSMFQNVAMLAKECEFIDYDTFKKDPGSYDGYAVYDNEEGEIMFPDRFSGTRDLLLPLPSRPMYLECEGLIRIELQNINVFIHDGDWWAAVKNE